MSLFEKKLNQKLFEALDEGGDLPEYMDKDEALNWIWQRFEREGRKKVLIPIPDPLDEPIDAVVFDSDAWDYEYVDNAEVYVRELHKADREHQARMQQQVPPTE